MDNKNRDFLFYIMIAIIYGIIFAVILVIFNLFSEDKESAVTITFQSLLFGIFMAIFELWQYNKKKRK